MNSLVDAASLTGTATAVVVNNLNVAKPAAGEPTLLTYEEATTLFHEFGHALHGLLGRSRYPELSGTSVFTDFVEFPSQVNEMWMLRPETLSNFAVHHVTGDPIPTELIERLRAAEAFNEGYKTSENLSASRRIARPPAPINRYKRSGLIGVKTDSASLKPSGDGQDARLRLYVSTMPRSIRSQTKNSRCRSTEACAISRRDISLLTS